METSHAKVLALLKARAGSLTDVTLRSGQVCRVLDIVWGHDDGTDVAHVTANIDASAEAGLELHFFHTDEVVRVVDPANGSVLHRADRGVR